MYINWSWPLSFMGSWPTTRLQDDLDPELTEYGWKNAQEYFALRVQHAKFSHKP